MIFETILVSQYDFIDRYNILMRKVWIGSDNTIKVVIHNRYGNGNILVSEVFAGSLALVMDICIFNELRLRRNISFAIINMLAKFVIEVRSWRRTCWK